MNDLINLLNSLASMFGSGDSPRVALMKAIVGAMLNPIQPNLLAQSYFDQMSLFVTVGLLGFSIETIYRLFRAVQGKDFGREARSWGISGFFLLVFVSVLPAFLLSCNAAFDEFSKWIAVSLTGSADPNELIKNLSVLTGNPGIDFFLTIFQMMFLLILGFTLVIMPPFLYVGGLLIIVGVTWRWAGSLGENLFHFALSLTVYAVIGVGVNLMFIGMLSWSAKLAWGDNAYARGMANTVIFILSPVITLLMLRKFKNQINAVVSGAVKTINRARHVVKETTQRISGAGSKQIKDAISARTGRSKDLTGGISAGGGKFKSETAAPPAAIETGRPASQPVALRNSTATRSQSRLIDGAKLVGSATAAYATRSPAAVVATVQHAKNFLKKDEKPPAPAPAITAPTAKELPAGAHAAPASAVPPRPTWAPASAHLPKPVPLAKAPGRPVVPPAPVAPPHPPRPPRPIQPPSQVTSERPAISKRAAATRPRPDLKPK